MIRPLLVIVGCLGQILALQQAVVAQTPLRVVTTTEDLAAVVRLVGGDAVEVNAIARGGRDPHYVEARPSYMRRLHRADLLLFNGLQLEIGWLPLLVEGSRNTAVAAGGPGNLNASEGIAVLERPTGDVDRSMGDIHPEGNPHYTLDPGNSVIVPAGVARRLGRLRPDRAASFTAAAAQVAGLLEARRARWQPVVEALRGTPVVAHHKQWEYLADWLGLRIVGYIENKPGIPPTAKHLAELVATMRQQEVRLVLHSTFVDPGPARRVAERSGAIAVELPAAVGAVDAASGTFELFDEILRRLALAVAPEPTD